MKKNNPKKIEDLTDLYKNKPKISEVISIVAHQLRHPISVIKGYLEALISEDLGKINQKQREYIQDALQNVKRMSGQVNYLLDVSRIEEGNYEITLKIFSLEDIIQPIIKDLALWIEATNCEISFERSKKPLPRVLADPGKIRHVVENLITNAIKYKKAGRGSVKVFLEKKGRHILFSCKDNGISVPREDFKKIFTKFYRSEEALEIDPSGFGLGLYLNKAAIELSGGKIWFSENRDFGMTFYFTLPIAREKV